MMASKTKQKAKEQNDIALRNFEAGLKQVRQHPIFAPLLSCVVVYGPGGTYDYDGRLSNLCPKEGLARVSQSGSIYCRLKLRAEPEAWARALAHCLLHLGMGHFMVKEHPALWNTACDLVVEKFLSDLKFSRPVSENPLPSGINSEEKLYQRFVEQGVGVEYRGFGMVGNDVPDMILDEASEDHSSPPSNWPAAFAVGLNNAVHNAVSMAGGYQNDLSGEQQNHSAAARAKEWFISSYPLLGAIAANFKLIEDVQLCQRMEIRVAAISCGLQEIYINPSVALRADELRFVMAHEFLHAALRHDARCQWRDAYLWNVACDFVINGWLTEMGLGERPEGLLYDPQFKGLNAEAVYDRIVTDMRTYRKLATLRGVGLGDILPGDGEWWRRGDGIDLDAFYRRALGQGLAYHQEQGRGYLPEGLIEEIRALSHPPIPWDVELARWFDEMFEPLEKIRSYARVSRRQSSTPDIPRPYWTVNPAALDGRTFGVVLDTSGSMDRALLASALGAIASYSAARDVPAARVVFCDAEAYDQGYMKPEDIAGTVKVKGRGGTVLQPGIELLEQAEDFPRDAPILIITDGYCEDRLILHGREHAYLIPEGARLPFVAKGKVFRMK
jgi:predicted metal-dependent peptidase